MLSFSCERKAQWNYETFFEQTYKLIEEKSIRRDELNWVDLKKTIKDSINSFETNDDVYRAIGYTVDLINDGHSIFIPPQFPAGGIINRLLIDTLKTPKINTKIIEDDIGYIELPGFVANDSLTHKYALDIRKALIRLDSANDLRGWIVDIRKNSGGKLGTEPLGLLPLFNHSLVGISCAAHSMAIP